MRVSARTVRNVLVIAVLCAVVGLTAYACAVRELGRDWTEDPRGPVFVSADGRTLLFAHGPAELGDGGDSCFSTISFQLSVQQTATTIAVQFHVHQAADAPRAVGSCAQPIGFPRTLDRPLGSRKVTDGHGHLLAELDGQRCRNCTIRG
ncbi:hypothetical protein DN069_23695 [Streptacidiphilus pinicola]|uniref:Uncharacterized protein n=1 Tax=Streptacidiphilus pinicola TaxID=2219663 RepID=A0A2X0K6C9_9ACTN|nr:hypothetical protein [Streptacidiphilus pinicola]RAG83119.1 hypothetical protein DN069_23695 [Streptacidiphilus pinicola]